MGASRVGRPIADDDARLDTIHLLCDESLMLDAWAVAEPMGPLRDWQGARAKITAGRLARHLGAGQLAQRLFVEAHRSHPDHPEVWFWYATALWERRGPLESWLFLKSTPDCADLPPHLRADLLQLRAQLAGTLGDFELGRTLLRRVDESLQGTADWLSSRAMIELRQDDPKRALDTCLETLRAFPRARSATQHAAAILEMLDQRERALELVADLDRVVQAATVSSQRAGIEHEAGLLDAELASLERYLSRSPLLDARERSRLLWRKAHNAYQRGDIALTRELSRRSHLPEASELANRLERATVGPRKCLELHALVQERLGCAPATLAMLTRYFGLPLDHVDVADQICYEGTSAQTERAFVEGLGWVEREFTLTFDIARALIDRGIPCGVVTVEAASAHMQAVVGYDLALQTLLIRDPMHPALVEAYADKFFQHYHPYGPRAVVILPPSEASRLDGLELLDEARYDALYRLCRHLEAGKRSLAEQELRELEIAEPDHRLTWWARRTLASYDADTYLVQSCSEALLRLYPSEINAKATVLACLSETGTETQRREQLESAANAVNAEWLIREQLAELLIDDARQHTRVRRLLKRVLRRHPTRAKSIGLLAQLASGRNDSREALELLRLAACLEPTNRDATRSYYQYAYWQGEASQAVELLRQRWQRYGKRSAEPAIAMFDALELLDRVDEALALLAEAVTLRPDDSKLWLFAAECYGRYHRFDEAESALSRAKELAHTSAFFQQAAALCEVRGRFGEALQHLRDAVELEPRSVSIHARITRLLAEVEGPDAACKHLEDLRANYPCHAGFMKLRIEWLSDDEPERAEGVLLELLQLQPSNAWAHRQMALLLRRRDRLDEALIHWRRAHELSPEHPATHAVFADLCLIRQDYVSARQALRRTLELWPDLPNTLTELLNTLPMADERRTELEGQFERARNATVNGNLLLEWFQLAQPLFAADQLGALAQRVNAERPQLWASWHVYGRQLLRQGDADGARGVLLEGVTRFPHVPALWLALSDTEVSNETQDRQRAALEKAVSVSPAYLPALLRLSRAHQRTGDLSAARHVLNLGLRHSPRSQELHQALADLEWNAGNQQTAFEVLERAILLDPGSAAGWTLLHEWGVVVGKADLAQRLAREIATQRPWNAQVWYSLAEVLYSAHQLESSIEALDQALQRKPTFAAARDLKAIVLTHVGRMKEAEQACSTEGLRGRELAAMKSRAAWILAKFGQLDAALEAFQQVVTQYPDHSWAWQQLIECHVQANHVNDARAAAERLVSLTPFDAIAHGYLANVHLKAGDELAAISALTRALNLKLDYAYAAENLIRLQLKRRKLDQAAKTLQLLSLSMPLSFRLTWAVEVAAASNDKVLAWEQFDRLLTSPSPSTVHLEQARAALLRCDSDGASRLLERASTQPTHAEAGALWVRSLLESRGFPSWRELRRLVRGNAGAGQTALREVFAYLGREGARVRILMYFLLYRHLVTEVMLWGKVGFALLRGGLDELAVHWLKDYPKRDGVQAWMLHNLRVAAMETHRPQLAHWAAVSALRLPSDETLQDHLAFAAFMEVTDGYAEKARLWIDGLNTDSLVDWNRWMVSTTSILLAESVRPRSERSTALLEGQLRRYGLWNALGWFGIGPLLRRAARAGLALRPSLTLFLYAFCNWILAITCGAWCLTQGESAFWGFVVLTVLAYLYARFRR